MSELPTGWASIELGAVTHINPRHISGIDMTTTVTFIPMAAVNEYSGTITEFQIRPLSEVWKGYTHIAEGDVLFAKITPCMENGKIAIAKGLENRLGCGSTEFHVFRSRGAIDAKYLWLFLRQKSFRNEAKSEMTGAVGQQRVTKSFLEEKQIPLAPLAEQKRVVAKVDSLSAKSARAREEMARVKKLIARLKQRVLAKAFDSSLDSVSLSFFVTGIKAGKNLKCVERPPYKDEKGVVKVSAVTWGEFDPLESKTLPLDFKPSADTLIRAGDFLFSRANTIELVGAAVIVKTAPDNLYLSDKILRLDFGIDAKAWILYYLRSPQGRHALQDISSGNQLSMRNIGQKNLMQLQVPNADASTRAEMVRHIESAFAKIDVIADEARRALDLTDRLDEAILAKAFEGELVPQDPNDEPASALLERIRAGRGVRADTPPALRKPGRPAKAKPSAPVFRESPTPVEKSRIDVAPDHLTQLLTADGHMTSEALWRRSGMSIDEFYKQLRLEINARTIRESDDNRLDAA